MTTMAEHLTVARLRVQIDDVVMAAIAAGVRLDHVLTVAIDVLADLVSQGATPESAEALVAKSAQELSRRIAFHQASEVE